MLNPKETVLPTDERVDALVCDVEDIDADLEYLHERMDNLSEWMDELDDHCSEHCGLIWDLCKNSDEVLEELKKMTTDGRDLEHKVNVQTNWLWLAVWLEAVVIALQLFNVIWW